MVVLRVDQAAGGQVICETPKRPAIQPNSPISMMTLPTARLRICNRCRLPMLNCHFTSPSVDHGRCNVRDDITHYLACAGACLTGPALGKGS